MRYFPETLPKAMGNEIATGYNFGPTGIYRLHPELNMALMRPNHERKMYFNRYKWLHKTDSKGFRNPIDRSSADILLLGDSMIYGHGVEEISTVRHHLEAILNRPVVNMGRQGNCIHQEYQVLKTFGIGYNPKHVFIFFLFNDIYDLTQYFPGDEMTRILQIPVNDHKTQYFDIKKPRSKLIDLNYYLNELYVVKSFNMLRQYLRGFKLNFFGSIMVGVAEASEASWDSYDFFKERPRYINAMRFHLRALLKIQDLAKSENFSFTHVYVFTDESNREERLYRDILQGFCKEKDINFLDLSIPFKSALKRGDELFLKGDGHFADAGARLTVEVLADYIELLENRKFK